MVTDTEFRILRDNRVVQAKRDPHEAPPHPWELAEEVLDVLPQCVERQLPGLLLGSSTIPEYHEEHDVHRLIRQLKGEKAGILTGQATHRTPNATSALTLIRTKGYGLASASVTGKRPAQECVLSCICPQLAPSAADESRPRR